MSKLSVLPSAGIRICRGVARLFLLSLALPVFGQVFTELSTSIPGLRYPSPAWGDCDNDGDLDLLVAGDTGTNTITRIYRNQSGEFHDIQAGLPGIADGAVAWGDYNGDGRLDFALTGNGTAGKISRIYRNNGNSTFTDINAGLPGLEASTLTWGDYDSDGDLDLFLTGYTGSSYVGAIYRNLGNDLFVDSGVTTVRGGASPSAHWVDFDSDGDNDLWMSGFTLDTTSGQSSRLYRNNNGVFTNITSMTFTAMSECSSAWTDYDNDGDLDLLLAGSYISGSRSYPTNRLYRNESGTGFTLVSTSMIGSQNNAVAWGDYDNDGYADVAMAGYNPSFQPMARLYRNFGGTFFGDMLEPLAGVFESTLAWGDYDNDGDLDLVLAGYNGTNNITRLYRNNSFTANVVPYTPTPAGVSVLGKTATLYWFDSGDPNQAGGLTFNLRVGTNSGGGQIMSPMSSLNGPRRLPRLGNTGTRTSWTLNLPIGTYYWAIQAVDHSWAGSPFSVEQTFEVPPQAPDAVTLPATNILVPSVTLKGIVNPNGDPTTVYFEYGPTLSYGSTTPGQAIGGGVYDVPISHVVSNLPTATTFHFRQVAVNNYGVSYGTNQTFTTPIFVDAGFTNLLGVGAGAVAWGDYDGDGDLDLLVAGGNSTGTVTSLYRNLGGTNFVDIGATNLAGVSYGTAMWGDYDGDGDLDLAVVGNSSSRIYRNDGSEVFTDINAGLPGLGNRPTAQWVDLDNDGDLDLVMSAGGSNSARICRNDGNHVFTSVTNSIPQISDSSHSWADYDNDGDQDLLLSGYNYGTGSLGDITRIYRNDGRGVFTNSLLSFQGMSDGSSAWGDYDNDGDMDFVVAGSISSRYTTIYSNNGSGTFTSLAFTTAARADLGTVAWGDYDNDGDLDLLHTGQSSTGNVARVYRNENNLFRDSGAVLPLLGNSRAAWGDYDHDGRLDIVLQGYTGSNYVTKVFRNLSQTANTPPNAPTGITTTVLNNAAILSWDAASDPNQSGSLTYNLRIGTTPGGSEVLSPMADLATGYRRVTRLGSTTLRTSQTITNLIIGTYYWSVQAVDHAFAGSPFSAPGSFTITAAVLPPVAVTRPATNVGLLSAALQGTVNAKGAPTIAFFNFGTNSTNFGLATAPINIGSATTNVALAVNVSNLVDGTTYYFRLAASNINGTVLGLTNSFTTIYHFSNITSGVTYFGAGDIAWGDWDNDGDLDLVNSGAYPNYGTVLYRNDAGTFTALHTNLPTITDGKISWGDYNNDGRLDLLISGSPGIYVMKNQGGGSFTTNAVIAGFGPAAWVDYDNDGDLDISFYNRAYYPEPAHIFRNDGGVFVESGVPLPVIFRAGMDWGDYDNDGDADLVMSGDTIITNFYVPITRIYRNDGYGEFTDIQASPQGLSYAQVAWRDFDNDGDLDLLCGGNTPNGSTNILYLNNGGMFTATAPGLPASSYPLAAVDYDNDGALDIVSGLSGSYIDEQRVFRNLGNATFIDSGKSFSWYYTLDVGASAWGDWDKDGDLDVFVGSYFYRNNLIYSNPPPATPTGLNSSRAGNRLTLQWNPVPDANQSGGMTYELQLGTAPGTYNLAAGAADADGWRRVARLGAIASPKWKLDLPVGTYYWRVQAIDNSFAGSPHSVEASFVVPVQAPAAITRGMITNVAGQLLMTGEVGPNGAATFAWFEFGPSAAYGSRTPSQAMGNATSLANLSNVIYAYQPGGDYHYRLVASNSFGVSYGEDRSLVIPPFIQLSKTYPVNGQAPLAWGDLDNDNDLDLVSNSVGAWNHLGRLTNYLTLPGSNARYPKPPALGDYDGDGDLDVLTHIDPLGLYRNDNGSFVRLNAILYGQMGAWIDFDNDGDLDIVTTGSSGGRIYRNDQQDVFVLAVTNLPALYYGSISCADYDADGDVDLAFAGYSTNTYVTFIFSNDGNGVFTDINAGLPGLDNATLAWGDYDRDGDPDLLLVGQTDQSTAVARVYRNDSGVFVDVNAGLPPVWSGGAAWGDYDGDGYLDIALAGLTNTSGYGSEIIRLYHNQGDGSFVSQWELEGAEGIPVWGDYDNDGRLDLLVSRLDYVPRLFRNNLLTGNSVPGTPSGLSAAASNGVVALSWLAASDPNQSAGLTYNVRIGTAPGAEQFCSAMANAATGWRRLPAPGNAGSRLSLTFTNPLMTGTYYWSVQAIDNSFAGSAFAAEKTFTLPAIAPLGQTRYATNIAPTSAGVTGTVFPGGTPAHFYFDYGLTTNYGLKSAPALAGTEARWHTVSTSLSNLNIGAVYNYRLVCFNTVGTNYGANATFLTPQFTDVGNVAVPWGASSVCWGDYDRDGLLDFAQGSGDYSAAVKIFRNLGNGSFVDIGVSLTPASWGDTKWGDYDNDGDLDLAALGGNGMTYYTLSIYRNDGGTNFTKAATLLSGVGMGGGIGGGGALSWGDYDNDGDLDLLAVAGGSGPFAKVFRNAGGGQFVDASAPLAVVNSASGAWGDYDQDGDLDILLTGYYPAGTTNITRLYVNTAGTFSESSQYFRGVAGGWAQFADLDNDNDLDILVSGATSTDYNAPNVTLVYRNDGGSFSEVATSLPGIRNGGSAIGDYNNDGRPDVFIQSGDGWSRLFRNDGGLVFTDTSIGALTNENSPIYWADFDNDNRLDYLATHYLNPSYRAFFYHNHNPATNVAPAVPTGLHVLTSRSSVELRWERATDANQLGGLTYNLRVGSTPGGIEILSPMANLATGRRDIAQLGNVQNNTTWKLQNLPEGIYYWSVQTIDNSFAGSPFAREHGFIISSRPGAYPQELIMGEDHSQPISLTGGDPNGLPLSYTVTASPTNGLLTGTAPNLVYRPRTNFFGMDRLIFEVSNGITNSFPATVSLVVTQVDDVAGSSLTIQRQTNGQPRITITGEPYERYVLEASQDLVHWAAVTNLTSSNGIMSLILADSGSYPKRFYRAALSLPAGRITEPHFTGGGVFSMQAHGELARTYQLQTSTNLSSWMTIDELLMVTSPVTFLDPSPTNVPARFYRFRAVR